MAAARSRLPLVGRGRACYRCRSDVPLPELCHARQLGAHLAWHTRGMIMRHVVVGAGALVLAAGISTAWGFDHAPLASVKGGEACGQPCDLSGGDLNKSALVSASVGAASSSPDSPPSGGAA